MIVSIVRDSKVLVKFFAEIWGYAQELKQQHYYLVLLLKQALPGGPVLGRPLWRPVRSFASQAPSSKRRGVCGSSLSNVVM